MTAQSDVGGGMPDDFLRAYPRAVSEGHTPDIAQEQIAVILDAIHAALAASGRRWWHPVKAVPGLYLWGGVGRGKTWLMDLFYRRFAGIRGRFLLLPSMYDFPAPRPRQPSAADL